MGVDTAPAFKPAKHFLYVLALSVKRPVVGDRHLAIGLRQYAGREALCGQGASKPGGVIAAIAEHRRGLRRGVEHQRRAVVVAHLAF